MTAAALRVGQKINAKASTYFGDVHGARRSETGSKSYPGTLNVALKYIGATLQPIKAKRKGAPLSGYRLRWLWDATKTEKGALVWEDPRPASLEPRPVHPKNERAARPEPDAFTVEDVLGPQPTADDVNSVLSGICG
jgi:hypothetical protein